MRASICALKLGGMATCPKHNGHMIIYIVWKIFEKQIRPETEIHIYSPPLNRNLPCARRCSYPRLSAIELTALQFLPFRVITWSRCFHTEINSTATLYGVISMTNLVARFIKNESGATAIEYGLIAALLSVGILGALQVAGGNLRATWERISAALTAPPA
jgi:pilus assembly protein Flp/PilA